MFKNGEIEKLETIKAKVDLAEQIAERATKYFEEWDMRPNLFTVEDADTDPTGEVIDYGHGVRAIRLDERFKEAILYLIEINPGEGRNTYAHTNTQYVYLLEGDLRNELSGTQFQLLTEKEIPARQVVRFYSEKGAIFIIIITTDH